MAKVERSIVIKATPEVIEEINNDINRLPEWFAGVEKAVADELYPHAGGQLKITYKVAGLSFDVTISRLEYEYTRMGRYKMEGMMTGNYEEILEPVDGGTRFIFRFDYQMPGGGVGKVVDRLFVERMNIHSLEQTLRNLKALAESQVQAAS